MRCLIGASKQRKTSAGTRATLLDFRILRQQLPAANVTAEQITAVAETLARAQEKINLRLVQTLKPPDAESELASVLSVYDERRTEWAWLGGV